MRSAQNYKKCTFLDNLRTITQETNMEARQMTPFSPNDLWSILVCKIPHFGQKLPIRTAHQFFLESRHPEVIKNPYYVLSPKRSQKKGLSSLTINITKAFDLINTKNLLGEFYAITAPDFWKMHLLVLLKICPRILL